MREETPPTHNVIPIEAAHGRRRGGRRFGKPSQVGDLTGRRRRQKATRTLRWAEAEERTRGKLRDLALREVRTFLGDLPTAVKPLEVPGSFLRMTNLPSEQIVVIREKEMADASQGSEATALFVIEDGEICMIDEEHLLGEILADGQGDRINTGLSYFRRAEGDELMRLCQDLCHRPQ